MLNVWMADLLFNSLRIISLYGNQQSHLFEVKKKAKTPGATGLWFQYSQKVENKFTLQGCSYNFFL